MGEFAPYGDLEVRIVGPARRHWWQRRKWRELPCRIDTLVEHPSKDVLLVGLTVEYSGMLRADRWLP